MPKTRSSRPTLALTRVAHKRQDFDTRTARTSRAGLIAAKGLTVKPVFNETEDGHLVREWTKTEVRSWKQQDLIDALKRERAVEAADLLGQVPLSAIKFAIYKGWLVKDSVGPYYFVTRLAQMELALPKKDRNGLTIKFHPNMQRWSERTGTTYCDAELNKTLPAVSFSAK